jgi:hypothetical protein
VNFLLLLIHSRHLLMKLLLILAARVTTRLAGKPGKSSADCEASVVEFLLPSSTFVARILLPSAKPARKATLDGSGPFLS